MDTVLRYMPIPPLYIRLIINPTTKRSIRQVVDGQQRLRTIFEFIGNEFPILAVHNEEFANMYYSDLPEVTQRRLLAYKFNVHVLENISDADVLSIFARINTYTVKLNDQELRNAEFFGAFKQVIYRLGFQHYSFWRNRRILSDMQIARMGEAELVSELVVSILDGIRQTKKQDLRFFYGKYDDEFPQGDKTIKEFQSVMDILGEIFTLLAKPTGWRRIPLFYSLFLAIYDARFGLPHSERPRISFTASRNKQIADRLNELGKIITSEEPPERYQAFINATKLSTADVGKRLLRHEFIWRHVLEKVI
jgi:hypothetical protein